MSIPETSLLNRTLTDITPVDPDAREKAKERLDQLAIPHWALGRLMDLALDLAAITAIYSTVSNKSIGRDLAFLGEVGLAGEIRPVSQPQKRLKELEKIGVTKVFGNFKALKEQIDLLSVIDVSGIEDFFTTMEQL